MATLQITEFAQMAKDALGNVVYAGDLDDPALTGITVTFTTSTQSVALQKTTRFVRLIADADCHVLAGANPIATASHARLEANVAEYFGVQRAGTTTTLIAGYDGTS